MAGARRGLLKIVAVGFLAVALLATPAGMARAQDALPRITVSLDTEGDRQEFTGMMQLLFLLTVLSLAPAILIMMTSFTRIVVVLSFVRSALATQQMPPNQILVGLALFLTFFVMAPVWTQVNQEALQPYLAGEIGQEAAVEMAMEPVRRFMMAQTREKDLALLVAMTGTDAPESPDDVPLSVLIPAFAASELKTAFQIGFMIFVPFIVIDMVVASTLMAMGMLMLPPMMISLPFKIVLFVLVDGWHLVIRSLVLSFR